MSDGIRDALLLAAALGSGLVAGALFAFSAFVMRALGNLEARRGVEAMQAINLEAPSAAFATAGFGTAALCLIVAVTSVPELGDAESTWGLAGSLAYLLAVVVTMAFNVPRNNALAAFDAGGENVGAVWDGYRRGWTAWNHVRVIAALAGAGMLTIALQVA